jgi:ankyrin repeat protein
MEEEEISELAGLVHAARNGYEKRLAVEIKHALELAPHSLDVQDLMGRTALMEACQCGRVTTATMLLQV